MAQIQESTPLKKLAQKMILIGEDVQYIQKQGHNQFHKYNYVTESDVVNAFSKAMQKQQVFMFSSIIERDCQSYKTRGGKDAFLVTVKLEVTFVDTESGEQFSSIFFGDGSDSDDKAIYKAITGAQKYALMKTFLVATGDDPEHDRQPETMKEQQTTAPNTSCQSSAEISATTAVEKSSTEISAADKKELLEFMRDKARQGSDVFRQAWRALSMAQRTLVRDRIGVYEQLAKQADSTLAVEDVPQ